MIAQQESNAADRAKKDLYEVGEIPPLGHIPKKMYAWAIRRDRHGDPEKSFQIEVVETPVKKTTEAPKNSVKKMMRFHLWSSQAQTVPFP